MATAADVDYPGYIGGRKQFRHDQVREEEVADVVRAELRLEAVDSVLVRRRHDGRVVDDDVDRLRPREDLCGCLADLRLRTEVELKRACRDTGVGGLELFSRLSALRGTTTCEDEQLRPMRSDDLQEVCTETAGGDAGNEDCLPGDEWRESSSDFLRVGGSVECRIGGDGCGHDGG